MDDGAAAQHLALLARTGLMTHVAVLEAPVTAEAVARFRAEAATQAGNLMAVGAGRFALCLPAGAREIATAVPHRLHPIAPEDGAAASASRGATASVAGPTREVTGAPPPQAPRPVPDGRAVLAALVEGQGTIAAGLDALAREVAAARAQQPAALAEAFERRFAAALSEGLPRLSNAALPAGPRQPDPAGTLADRLETLAETTRAAQTRIAGEVRAVAATVETLAARIATLEAARVPAPSVQAGPTSPPPRPAATVTPLHARPAEDNERRSGSGELPEGLDGMLQTILARLARIAQDGATDAPPTGEAPVPQGQRAGRPGP